MTLGRSLARLPDSPQSRRTNGEDEQQQSDPAKAAPAAPAARDDVRRDVLPIPDAQHVGLTTYDAKDPNTSYPPISMLRPPKGAPNVLIVLIDDVGFARLLGVRRAVSHPGRRAAGRRRR